MGKKRHLLYAGALILFMLSLGTGCSNMIAEYARSGNPGNSPVVNTGVIVPKNAVGVTDSVTLRSLDYTPDDSNSIFAAKSGSDTTGTGTEASPFASINHALTLCDASHQKIVILDSGTYEEKGFEFTGNFRGLYAALGEKPVLKLKPAPGLCDISAITEVISETGSGTGSIENVYMEQSAVLVNGSFVAVYGSMTEISYSIIDESGAKVVENGLIGTYTGSSDARPSVAALHNGNWALVYNRPDNNNYYFQIRDSSGNPVVPETLIKGSGYYWSSCATLNNGNWVVTYVTNATGYVLNFRIYDEEGNTVIPETEVTDNGSNRVSQNHVASFGNGNFVIVWSNYTTSNRGATRFKIYDQNGTPQTPLAVDLDSNSVIVSWGDITVLDNDSWVTVYTSDSFTLNTAVFTIRDSTGADVLVPSGPRMIDGTAKLNPVITTLGNGRWWLAAYVDDSDSSGKFRIFDETGNIVRDTTTYKGTGIIHHTAQALANGNVVFFYTGYYYTVWYPYSWTGIRVSADAVINGLDISPAGRGGIENLIEGNSAILGVKYSELSGCRESANPSIGCYAVRSGSGVTISNSKVYDNDIGVWVIADAVKVVDSQFYFNSAGYGLTVDGNALLTGDILVNHCDFFNNSGGIRFLNNNGANEIVKNTISHGNSLYGINADIDISFSSSLVTDPVLNVNSISDVLTGNPSYVNEGSGNPDNVDLNIRVTETGYPADSPARDLADDDRNAGAYDVEYVAK